MKTIDINHKQSRTNYTGLDEGAVPVKVYRKAKFVAVHVDEPKKDTMFNNYFREVKFVELGTDKVFVNTLFDGHYTRLQETLTTGNIVEIEYEVDTNWIRSVNGKRWN